MRIESLFGAGVSPEADVGIAGEEVNRRIGVTVAGGFGLGGGRRGGLCRDEWRQIRGGAASSVWGAGLSGGGIGRVGGIVRKSLREKKGPKNYCRNNARHKRHLASCASYGLTHGTPSYKKARGGAERGE